GTGGQQLHVLRIELDETQYGRHRILLETVAQVVQGRKTPHRRVRYHIPCPTLMSAAMSSPT
ncbi:MAG: hypothetical protein ACRDUW_20695, partial [Pseudonocardiaceae bacterium]